MFDLKFVQKLTENINSDKCNLIFNKYIISEDSDFTTAPASTRFHHNYAGGLLVHCCQIFETLLRYKLHQMFKLDKIEFSQEDAYILAFGHDLSKINKYREEQGWTKVNGKWESILKYGYNDSSTIPHELGSVYMISKLIPDIKFEIIQALAYHHGGFGSFGSEFLTACQQNPLVLALHTADMESCIEG